MEEPLGEVVSVLIVDDHPLVREGTRHLLELSPLIGVVQECGSGEEALAAAEEFPPDVAVVDLSLPGMNGIELIRRLVECHPAVKILVLSAYGEEEYLHAALAAGASGFLLKASPSDEIARCIDRIHRGETVIDRELQVHRADENSDTTATLTEREREILTCVSEGMSNKAIASQLGISRRTVEGHISRVLAKARVSSRTELLRWALSHGFVILERGI